MTAKTNQQSAGGITLLGLGPGDPGMITRSAWDWLANIEQLYLRTKHHPTVASLPVHLSLVSFDGVYKTAEKFEDVYEIIIEKILILGREPGGVTYGVPGHPFVAEATCPEIAKRAERQGIVIKVIDGLSFLEPTFRALGIDPFPDLILTDAMRLSIDQTPGFPPSSPALISQIYSRSVASDVKLTLMAAYPDEHPIKLIHGAGTDDEQIEALPLYAVDQSPHLGYLSSMFVPPLSQTASFEAFQEVVARLRAPDGCPWDREQTHESLRPFLLEEAYETLEALDRMNMAELQEELGDLLLQIFLHAQIATEEGDFNIHHVVDQIATKLIRRHPHVFSEVKVDGVSGVIRNWEAIKAEERRENNESEKKGLLDGVPLALPALLQAQEIVERVGRVGFNHLASLGNMVDIHKNTESIERAEPGLKTERLGELLLAVVAFAHQQGMDAESALRKRLMKFRKEFNNLEDMLLASGKSLAELTKEEKARFWSDHPMQEPNKDDV